LKPGEWEINEYFELKNKNNQFCGEVYIGLNFIPNGFLDKELICPDLEPLLGIDNSIPKIEGSF
jgi:hypothetical protein